MNPRSLTPLWRMPRSSRRSTAWKNVAWESANARWCTQPGSVGVRAGSGTRSSSVKTVIRRPSPGSKYRWLSAALSRFGCSNTNGIPSRPSQKSIDVCRSAPTMVMWWTPWLCSLRTLAPGWSVLDEFRLVLAALQGPERDQLDLRGDHEQRAQAVADRGGEVRLGLRGDFGGKLDGDRQRRLLLDAGRRRAHEDVPAHARGEGADDLAD